MVALSITNEANLPGSPNTSDGFYTGVRDALVQGVIAARAEADRLGRPDLALGFSYAYRNTPAGRRRVLRGPRRQGRRRPSRPPSTTSACRSTPGLFWPPATTDPAGDVDRGATLLRDVPGAEGRPRPRRRSGITENGYATRGGTGEDRQAADLTGTVDALAR